MRKLLLTSAALVVGGFAANANESVQSAIDDAANWAIQTGDYEEPAVLGA